MLYDYATKKYITIQHSANKTRQVVMLYDGIIRYVGLAMEAIDNKDIEVRYNVLEKAVAIINGLQASLDFKQGGEVAKLLDEYYFSLYMRLMAVQMNDKKIILEHVKDELVAMRDAWQNVDEECSNGLSQLNMPCSSAQGELDHSPVSHDI